MQTNRTYRCTYQPLDRDGFPVPCESGTLPYVVLMADSAEAAQRAAHAQCKAPIVDVERIEPADLRKEREAALELADGIRINLRTPWALPGARA
jgi:hypothetical protein